MMLRQKNLLNGQLRFQHIAAECLIACKEWEECLLLMGEDDDEVMTSLNIAWAPRAYQTTDINIKAALCLTRAKVYTALENHERAVFWYSEALRRDVKCMEAFDVLVQQRMLTHAQQVELINSLDFPPECTWLAEVYQLHMSSHDPSCTDVPERKTKIEKAYLLADDVDVYTAVAQHHYARNEFTQCHAITKQIVLYDPYHHSILPVHVCSMVELEMKSELFYCAHQLVDAYPDRAITWFAVACYYFLIGKFDVAGRYFK
jgi:anaphase-promoting complex subunit 6